MSAYEFTKAQIARNLASLGISEDDLVELPDGSIRLEKTLTESDKNPLAPAADVALNYIDKVYATLEDNRTQEGRCLVGSLTTAALLLAISTGVVTLEPRAEFAGLKIELAVPGTTVALSGLLTVLWLQYLALCDFRYVVGRRLEGLYKRLGLQEREKASSTTPFLRPAYLDAHQANEDPDQIGWRPHVVFTTVVACTLFAVLLMPHAALLVATGSLIKSHPHQWWAWSITIILNVAAVSGTLRYLTNAAIVLLKQLMSDFAAIFGIRWPK